MKDDIGYRCRRMAGPRLRCFLSAALPVVVVMGFGGTLKGFAASTCAPIPEMKLSHLQGTVYGPSGVPLPQILVRVMRDGIPVNQAQTDSKGRFAFKTIAPGSVVLHIQFLGSKSLDVNTRMVHSLGLFHTAHLRIVLGLSGTKCSFATTSTKLYKDQMKRYNKQLEETYSSP